MTVQPLAGPASAPTPGPAWPEATRPGRVITLAGRPASSLDRSSPADSRSVGADGVGRGEPVAEDLQEVDEVGLLRGGQPEVAHLAVRRVTGGPRRPPGRG